MEGPQPGAASAPAPAFPWAGAVTSIREEVPRTKIDTTADRLPDVCKHLKSDLGYRFATLVVEQTRAGWQLNYLFTGNRQGGVVQVVVHFTGPRPQIPSITAIVHAADWHERETEDLFGLGFEGHPRLGDFVLHEHWPEGINPMRSDFDAAASVAYEEICPWQPDRIAQASGAFVMPIGPVYSDFAESAHFLLETVGEDVIRVIPRLFYKYRGVEKLAEGRSVENVLLLTERFSGTSAFAHSLGFCQAVEAIDAAKLPARAKALRVFLAELERCRHHVGVITEICGSTGLAVATSQGAILEEELLRLSGQYTGHRYLFGLNVPGGLSLALDDESCRRLGTEVSNIVRRLGELVEMLRFSSSFLDRIEQVGAISRKKALEYGLVGPVSRASGMGYDLRIDLPYAFYGNDAVSFTVPCEQEGDGYARLRLFFAEAVQSARIMGQIATSLPPGEVRCPLLPPQAGAALGWVEAPRGAAFHWVRIAEDGHVARYRVTPPSFANWHGFHLAAENFAFQDFPIIMATFALSNAECDR